MEPPAVQYVTTSDGINLAYTVSGTGQPFVFVPNLMNHVLLSWEMPGVGTWLRGLADRFTLIRYDSRGMGMSTRGLREDHSFNAYQVDLETVLERLKLEEFVLCGQGSGCQIAVRYAVRHAERVRALILIGNVTVRELRAGELLFRTLPKQDWDQFLHTVASSVFGLSQDIPRIVELLRQSVTQKDWLNRRRLVDDFEDVLAEVRTPSLVIHARENFAVPVESSMKLAQLVKGRLAVIDGADNFGDQPQGMRAIETFLAGLPLMATKPELGLHTQGLSARQVEVLRLLADGMTNREIAGRLVLSERTVQRHVADVYAKIGVRNRAEATAFALNSLVNS